MLGFSCNKSKKLQESDDIMESTTVNSNQISNTNKGVLFPMAKQALSKWKEYNDVDEFIHKFYEISVSEALNNAQELTDLVKLMKDTIRVEKLEKPSVIARFNVLHNETLRLADIATISTITEREVKEEVTKILEIYAALNSKINTIYKVEDIQNSLEVDTEIPLETEMDESQKKVRKKERGKLIKPKSSTVSSKQ